MSPRNKFIVLGVLVALLGIVAYFQLGRSKAPAHVESAPPAPRSAAMTKDAK